VCWRTDRAPGLVYPASINDGGGTGMLKECDAIAVVAVADLAAAAAFYEGTLGLARLSSEGEEAMTTAMSSALSGKRKPFHFSRSATAGGIDPPGIGNG
jgi:hypothetical protein